MEVRLATGLREHAPRTPLTPAPKVNRAGTVDWSSRPLDAGEIIDFIRAVLKPEKGCERKLSSHSCKATALSWLAKFGTLREDRDVLGRHVSSIEGAGPLYSRDLVSAPLRKDRVIAMTGREGRSGMILAEEREEQDVVLLSDVESLEKRPRAEEAKAKEEPDWAEAIGQWDWEELSQSSSQEDDESSGDEAIALNSSSARVEGGLEADGLEVYRRKVSRLVHACEAALYHGLGYCYTRCGRKISANFEKLDARPDQCMTCSHCFRRKSK